MIPMAMVAAETGTGARLEPWRAHAATRSANAPTAKSADRTCIIR